MIRTIWWGSLLLVVMCHSCSMEPVAGGSASEGEAKVMGAVVTESIAPAESVAVTIRTVTLTAAGEKVIFEKSVYTDANGNFLVERVPEGTGVVYCRDSHTTTAAIEAELTIDEDSLVTINRMQLRSATTIRGRVLIKSTSAVGFGNVKVFIPGIQRGTTVDGDGFYTLTDVPQGQYALTFLCDSIVNYLPITIENASRNDTAYIRDVRFAFDIKDADNVYSVYPHELNYSFSIIPKKYNADQIPDWYTGKDFSSVRYYEVVDNGLKPIWRFSVIVGVSDSIVRFYGGMEAVKILLTNQMDSVNNVYNELGVFNGTFEFAIDSFYEFTGDGSDQIALPPPGYDYRVIHDEAPPPDQNYWYNTARSIYHYYRPDVDSGLTGTYSMENLAWEFGLARGAIILQHLDVLAGNNPINGESYTTDPGFMYKCHESRIWDRYSIHLINYYTDEVFSENVLLPQAIPASLGVIARSATGTPLSGSVIHCYPVRWDSWAVTDTAILTGTTDADGVFQFPGNPYSATGKDTVIYTNFLIQAVNGQDTAYSWMPLNKVGEAWFANQDTLYRVGMDF